jgi:hypothetical protein
MAKDAQDSTRSLDATNSDAVSEANPYLNDDANAGSRFAWIKGKPAKITAIAVGGALALGAVFAGGVVAGQISSHDDKTTFGEQFDGDRPDGDDFGKPGKFGPDGDGDFENHPPRPPHDFDGQQPQDGDRPAAPDDSISGIAPDESTQSN